MATAKRTSVPVHGADRPQVMPARTILDRLGAAVLLVDDRRTIQYRNAVAAAWLPDDPDLEAALSQARMLEPFEGWAAVIREVIGTGSSRRFEGALTLPGRSAPTMVTFRCTPVGDRNAPGGPAVVILLVEEMSQEAVEQQLEVSSRLASLGKLATRVAHELNNPLDGILRYINLAMRMVEDASESKLKSYLAESRTGLMRMVQIIGDLLEYSRTTDGAFDAVNINEVVEQAIRSTASAADTNGVVVAADFQSEQMPTVSGLRLYQVCCNLIKNAIEAMPDGGRVSITTGRVQDQIVVQVADTGPGLPDPPDKVFEPFFTTKAPGKGTGLGLAICKEYVEGLGGTITAAPGSEGGAIFTVWIPLSSCHQPCPLTEAPHA